LERQLDWELVGAKEGERVGIKKGLRLQHEQGIQVRGAAFCV